MFFGRVFFFGFVRRSGSPHVPRAYMWALNTCGEPNDIELTTRERRLAPTVGRCHDGVGGRVHLRHA